VDLAASVGSGAGENQDLRRIGDSCPLGGHQSPEIGEIAFSGPHRTDSAELGRFSPGERRNSSKDHRSGRNQSGGHLNFPRRCPVLPLSRTTTNSSGAPEDSPPPNRPVDAGLAFRPGDDRLERGPRSCTPPNRPVDAGLAFRPGDDRLERGPRSCTPPIRPLRCRFCLVPCGWC
jgi:hypothetical protein